MTMIVGSGPAGLTAAYLLAKRGEKVTVIEKAERPGGLWRGFDYTVRNPYGPNFEPPKDFASTCHFEMGMHWYTDCGVPEIDAFWWGLLPPEDIHVIERELAGCWWNGRLQTNCPYPDVRNGGQFDRAPVLEKLWGVPYAHLSDDADKLVKIGRVVAHDEAETARIYATADPLTRSFIAWPDQRTLPQEYRSGRRHFYPKAGMRALVNAAVKKLEGMGVHFLLRADPKTVQADHYHASPRVIWAAGLKSAAECADIPWPDMTPPRRLTVVNMLWPERPTGLLNDPGTLNHDLHYAFNYDQNPNFRVTWYDNFAPDPPNRVTCEYFGGPDEEACAHAKHCASNGATILGVHDLGPVLPVPTIANDAALEGVRDEIIGGSNLKLIGSGATPGLFYQPEILAHVAEVCG